MDSVVVLLNTGTVGGTSENFSVSPVGADFVFFFSCNTLILLEESGSWVGAVLGPRVEQLVL